MSRPSMYDVFLCTLESMLHKLKLDGFLLSEEIRERVSVTFMLSKAQTNPLFGCVGALDELLIAIVKPGRCDFKDPAQYYSRKEF